MILEGRGFTGRGKSGTADYHLGAQAPTPPESGGVLLKNSAPQLRRGGAPSAGVVLSGALNSSFNNDMPMSFSAGSSALALQIDGENSGLVVRCWSSYSLG